MQTVHWTNLLLILILISSAIPNMILALLPLRTTPPILETNQPNPTLHLTEMNLRKVLGLLPLLQRHYLDRLLLQNQLLPERGQDLDYLLPLLPVVQVQDIAKMSQPVPLELGPLPKNLANLFPLYPV